MGYLLGGFNCDLPSHPFNYESKIGLFIYIFNYACLIFKFNFISTILFDTMKNYIKVHTTKYAKIQAKKTQDYILHKNTF